MTCKNERPAGGEKVVIRVCGRIQLEHVSTMKDLIGQEKGVVILDLIFRSWVLERFLQEFSDTKIENSKEALWQLQNSQ
jgi:hypothetical protein